MNIDLEQFESEVEDLEAGARKKKLEKDVRSLKKIGVKSTRLFSQLAHVCSVSRLKRAPLGKRDVEFVRPGFFCRWNCTLGL